MASSERFGYEWEHYSYLLPIYEKQFRLWIGPVKPPDFHNKTVLDAGCGMGRNSYWAASYGASKIVAFDFDHRSVAAAKNTLKDYPNAKVLFDSIYDIEYDGEFDIVFSIGVIHHLDKPQLAIEKLWRAVKPGGKLIVWVYGRENNGWKIFIVNSVRWFTSRLPLPFTHTLTYFFSVPLFLLTKLSPVKGKYLRFVSGFNFNHLHLTVFDQLIPRRANYWTKDEALCFFEGLSDKKDIQINSVLDYSWSVVTTKNP